MHNGPLTKKKFPQKCARCEKSYIAFKTRVGESFFQKIAIYLKYILGREEASRGEREETHSFLSKLALLSLLNRMERKNMEGKGVVRLLFVRQVFSSGDSFSSFIMIMPSFILSLNRNDIGMTFF